MKSTVRISLLFSLILATLFLAACGVAPATPTNQPVQDTPAQPAASPTSAQSLPTDTQAPPGEATPTQEPASPTPAPSETPTPVPTNTPSLEDCQNKAEFVEDVSVPDDTEFLPGEKFTKTWRLRNAGTCPWTKDYNLVFAKGDQMSAASPVSLPGEVPPGQTVDVSVELTAPAAVDTYRGEWQLNSPAGVAFGIGKDADKTFYVQIVVGASTADLDLGSPDWKDTFENARSWYLLNTENVEWEVEDGRLRMTAHETGQAEEWGLTNRPEAGDFYLEATFRTGDTCSGPDRYGMLVRAPGPNEGYVFSFSCDGRYRAYKWDGENYNAIIEWKTSPHILAGPDQSNRLGVWAEGSTLKFYANGKLLGEFEDDTYAEGSFGLLIGSAKTEDLQVYVEEVNFWNLN